MKVNAILKCDHVVVEAQSDGSVLVVNRVAIVTGSIY